MSTGELIQPQLVVIAGGNVYHDGAALEGELKHFVINDIKAGDMEAFGEYPDFHEYFSAFVSSGFMIAEVDDLNAEIPRVIAKGGLMHEGLGDLALAGYERELPAGVGHHEGYFTRKGHKAKGTQQRLISEIESSANQLYISGSTLTTDFTAALDPEYNASTRNFMRKGYVGVAFDPDYLQPPIGETEPLPSLVSVKTQEHRVAPFNEEAKIRRVELLSASDNSKHFYEGIRECLDDGYVCVWVDRVENPNERDVDDSTSLTFMHVDGMARDAAKTVKRLQPEIAERMSA